MFFLQDKFAKLLQQPTSRNEALSNFIRQYPKLAWIHDIRTEQFTSASLVLLEEAKNEKVFLGKRKVCRSFNTYFYFFVLHTLSWIFSINFFPIKLDTIKSE